MLPWRIRRLRGPARGEPDERRDPVGASARHQRSYARAERAGAAATADDRLLDAVVVGCVVMFVLLVAGVGMLVVQAALAR